MAIPLFFYLHYILSHGDKAYPALANKSLLSLKIGVQFGDCFNFASNAFRSIQYAL